MLFNSFAFAVFLPIVFLLYWAVPQKNRYQVLLIVSYYFYMSWNVKYVVLILFTTFISYACALALEKSKRQQVKKVYVASAIVASLLVLFFFKYFNFASATIFRIAQKFAIPLQPLTLQLLLPVGISFYTFQTLSYVIDVYKGDVQAEKNFFKYAAFISFFPQLVAGPIERTQNLLPQIDGEHIFHYEKAAYGMRLMAWGFFKKMVIADNLAIFVDQVFDDVKGYQGFSLVLAVLFFTIQIYCDFSGYSDIAIGCAKLFDIDLMTNFKSPYFATSVKDFWRRWHISLSSWFRDYVYIPLGGSRVSGMRTSVNLMITFLASGLWHGAAFTYIVWGGLHGAMQVFENTVITPCKRWAQRVGKESGESDQRKMDRSGQGVCGAKEESRGIGFWCSVILVFIFVSLAWCFFRAGSCRQALWVIYHMKDGVKHPYTYLIEGIRVFDTGLLKQLLLPVLLLFSFDYVALNKDPLETVGNLKVQKRYVIYVVFFLLFLFMANFGSQEFVYFQF